MVLTIPVVARLLGVAERTLRYWCEAGKIPAQQVAVKKVQNRKRKGRWYIPYSWVLEVLKEKGLVEGEEAFSNAVVFKKVIEDIFHLELINATPKERLNALLNYYRRHPNENPVRWIQPQALPITIEHITKDIIEPFIKLPKKVLKEAYIKEEVPLTNSNFPLEGW